MLSEEETRIAVLSRLLCRKAVARHQLHQRRNPPWPQQRVQLLPHLDRPISHSRQDLSLSISIDLRMTIWILKSVRFNTERFGKDYFTNWPFSTTVVQRSLTDTNEEGIRSFHHSLADAKQTIGGDLQRNVYRNYTEFVQISKEVSNLDADVLQLKGYLNELRSIWDSLLEDSGMQDDVSSSSSSMITGTDTEMRFSILLPLTAHLWSWARSSRHVPAQQAERYERNRFAEYLQSTDHCIVG